MNSNVIDVSAAHIERRERPSQALQTMPDATPMQMLAIAVHQGADIAKIEKLMALQERWEANQARKAYVAAMAAFKANPPTIVKNKHVEFQTNRGTTSYNHATHDEVTNKVIVALSPHGFSHNWTVRQENNLVFVKCTVTHELGHGESSELYGPPDTTGTKSAIQAISSTVTLLQRYTLLSVTGLTSQEISANDADDRTDDPPPQQPEESMPLEREAAMREYAEKFVASLDISDQAVIDIHNELNADQRFYRDVWSKISSSARRAIKDTIERVKVNS